MNLDLPSVWINLTTLWDAPVARRVTAFLSGQGSHAIELFGDGVARDADGGETGFAVTDSGGLTVDIAPGRGIVTHGSKGTMGVLTTTPVTLDFSALVASPVYIHCTAEIAANDTRESRLPKFIASLLSTNANGILLATVTHAAGAITGIEDNRAFIEVGGGGGGAWSTGSGVPTGGADGDLYLRTSNGDVYQRIGGTWSVVANIKGPAGTAGSTGATGATGASTAWTSGTAAPDDGDGANGDWFINLTTLDIYKKVSGAWEIEANIKGPRGVPGGALNPLGDWLTATVYAVLDAVRNDGGSYFCKVGHTSGSTTEPGTGADWADYWTLYAQDGATGAAGANGTTFFNGSGAPGGGVGVNGDYYLDTDVLDLYQKAAGSWSIIVNLKAAGVGVPAGGTTGQILAKINGTDYNTQWVPAPTGGGGAAEAHRQKLS